MKESMPAILSYERSLFGLEKERKGVLFNPVVKVVSSGCNLRCNYCFYGGLQPEVKLMSLDTLDLIIRRFLDFSPRVTFYWHGGEPLLAGRSFYEEVLRIQSEAKKPGQVVENCIQTNATLLDEEWVDFFKKSAFRVGISIDGPKEIHNLNRIDA